ncbi:MAG: HAD-IC family P-type ATPase [Rhodospirillaceae bacterium]|nr:HAD-IC family P-type ATPase [Rhodospirillaceae bacterium]
MDTRTATDWHALTPAEALAKLESSDGGLAEAEAATRLERYGPNRLAEAKPRSALRRLLDQFDNLLIFVLFGAAVVTALLGHWTDSGVIIGVTLINAAIGFVQEGRAEQALAAVRRMLVMEARVLRGGRKATVDAADLVPGDIVLLAPGDKVPADLRLLAARGLRVDEAALTGESVPVEKTARAVAETAILAERGSMLYAGTLVAAGQAKGVVAATGAATELGHIGGLLAETQVVATPLMAKLARFGRQLTIVILGGAAAVFAFGTLVHGWSAAEMFLAAVGLAVAAIPESLPAIVTIVLAIGVRRMAQQNAIVRRLPAVETLGEVTVICSDKTGTLTRNELSLRESETGSGRYSFAGEGYAPSGSVARAGELLPPPVPADLASLLRAGALCNDAVLRESDGGWIVEGDPTEGALLAAAQRAGIDPLSEAARAPRLDVIPFEPELRFMATLHRAEGEDAVAYIKGAPERVLAMCDRSGDATPFDSAAWMARARELAAAGFRVLGLAEKRLAAAPENLEPQHVASGCSLLGLCAMIDAARPEAVAAVAACRRAGISVRMITGDHPETARAIAQDFGLPAENVLSGRDIDALDEAAFAARVPDVAVFARASPEHKLRIVGALKAEGHVVAMTGDGSNDAPALKRADVGIAMGRKGTEAAKEAAAMVLSDDNFASIAAAVREGRICFDNLRKTIAYILPTNGGEALVVMAAVLLGLAMPITPLHILWINLVTEVTLSLALAFEPGERDVMARPPRPPAEPLLSRFIVWRIVLVSLAMAALAFGVFQWELARGHSLEAARTAAVNIIVACEMTYLINTRRLHGGTLSLEGWFGSRAVWIAFGLLMVVQAAFTYAPPLQALFDTAALDAASWGMIAAGALLLYLVVEAEKAITRRWMARAGGNAPPHPR